MSNATTSPAAASSPATNAGHTAWILVSMALVQLMMPGLAFFYAGLLKSNSVVTMIMQNFAAMGIITVLWFAFVFSLCFGHTYGFVGSITTFGGFNNVGGDPLYHNAVDGSASAGTVVADIPGLVFAGYQGMFAVITPALMTGAFADRLRFAPYLVFISVWIVLVYAPFCHWVWGGGWMGAWGVKDFAGGIVVHTTAGFSALAVVHALGKRSSLNKDKAEPDDTPHSIPMVALGTGLLWFGWFGFNGGSALASTGSAAFAAVNSEIAASTALCVWTMIDTYKNGKPSLVGLCVGAIAGLATITPCAGFIRPWAAFCVGVLAAVFCYACCELKNKMQWDDALDVWGVHGMGGLLGSILVGIFADENVGGVAASGELFGKQCAAVALAAVYSYVLSFAMIYIIGTCMELKPKTEEMDDLDWAFHGERAYVMVVQKDAAEKETIAASQVELSRATSVL
jgi:Amt family ammonium transporter